MKYIDSIQPRKTENIDIIMACQEILYDHSAFKYLKDKRFTNEMETGRKTFIVFEEEFNKNHKLKNPSSPFYLTNKN